MMIVCIDPGHGQANKAPGQFDPGCVYGGFREADVALDWAFAVKRALERRQHPVVLTRSDSLQPCPLGTRAWLAQHAGAAVMLSIHCNASPDGSPGANGTEVCYHADGTPGAGLARMLAVVVSSSLGLRNRGAQRRPDLAVLKGPVPSVLIELGFLSSPVDRAAITDSTGRQLTALAIATAITTDIKRWS